MALTAEVFGRGVPAAKAVTNPRQSASTMVRFVTKDEAAGPSVGAGQLDRSICQQARPVGAGVEEARSDGHEQHHAGRLARWVG